MTINSVKQLTVYAFPLMLLGTTVAYATETGSIDAHIRQVVEDLLKEKDKKIQQLEARIEQLALKSQLIPVKPIPPLTPPKAINANPNSSLVNKLSELGAEIGKLQHSAALKGIVISQFFNVNPHKDVAFVHQLDDLSQGIVKLKQAAAAEGLMASNPIEAGSTQIVASDTDSAFMRKLGDLGVEVAELKQAVTEKGLDIGGFMDFTAKTDNATGQNFHVGSVELDLQYAYNDHFAASSALIFTALPGLRSTSVGAGYNGIAVALLDYHLFDSTIPPRGRIFNGQGFHIQAGRFDLPFSTDYQNFANTDRVTVSAPITTSRMQFGGFNGDGFRSYGAWKNVNYSLFWTDTPYAQQGNVLGGRLGFNMGQNTYRIHNANPEGIEVGFSHLSDLDKQRDLRHSIYGADLSFSYGFLKLQSEFMWQQAHQSFIGANKVDYGKPNELGYHTTLIADLESFIHQPVLAVARYGRWQPDNQFKNDWDGNLVAINNVSALTVGLKYTYSNHFKFKLEYTDSLGTSTGERYFDKRLGIAQVIVGF